MADESRMIFLAQELYDTCNAMRYPYAAAGLFVFDAGSLVYALSDDPARELERATWLSPMISEQKKISRILDFSRAEALGKTIDPIPVPDTVRLFYRNLFPISSPIQATKMCENLKRSLEFFTLWGTKLLGETPDSEQVRRFNEYLSSIQDYVDEKIVIENMT